MYPAERGGLALVWPLAPHPTNKNELIVWDCAADPAELLLGLKAADIRQRMFTRQEDLPEGVTRLALKTIHVNKSPIVLGKLPSRKSPSAGAWTAHRACATPSCWHKRAAAGRAVERGLRARAAAAAGRRRRPLRWLRRQRRPPRPAARACAVAAGVGGPCRAGQAGLPGRASGRNRVPLPGAQLSRHALKRRAGALAAHCAARLHDGVGGAQTLTAYMDKLDQLGEAADDAGRKSSGRSTTTRADRARGAR